MERGGCVYIMANEGNTTLYIGVTSNLKTRVWEHKNKVHPNSFTSRYNLFKLVYFESFSTIVEAIAREKQLKNRSRKYKDELINKMNNRRVDLYKTLED